MEMDNDNVLNRRTESSLNLPISAENGVEEISKLERAWLIFIPLDSKRIGWGLGLNVKTSETNVMRLASICQLLDLFVRYLRSCLDRMFCRHGEPGSFYSTFMMNGDIKQ